MASMGVTSQKKSNGFWTHSEVGCHSCSHSHSCLVCGTNFNQCDPFLGILLHAHAIAWCEYGLRHFEFHNQTIYSITKHFRFSQSAFLSDDIYTGKKKNSQKLAPVALQMMTCGS